MSPNMNNNNNNNNNNKEQKSFHHSIQEIGRLYAAKRELLETTFPELFSSEHTWKQHTEQWSKLYEEIFAGIIETAGEDNGSGVITQSQSTNNNRGGANGQNLQSHWRHNFTNKPETALVQWERHVALLCEKLEYFIAEKKEVSVLNSTKYINDVYSVYYSIQSLLSPNETKQWLFDQLKPEAKQLWNIVTLQQKERRDKQAEHQQEILKDYRDTDLPIVNEMTSGEGSYDPDMTCDWYHFSVTLENTLLECKTQMNMHMNPYIHVEQVQFKYDSKYMLLARYFLMSHSMELFQSQKMPVTVDNIASMRYTRFNLFDCQYEVIHLRDLIAFTRRNDLLMSFADMLLTEAKEIQSKNEKTKQFYVHLNKASLELCYAQKSLFWTEFRRLFFFVNKEITSIPDDSTQRNIIRTNALRKAAKKYHFDIMWTSDPERYQYEKRLQAILTENKVLVKNFSFDAKVVKELVGTDKLEEFPAMLLTNNHQSFEPGILVFADMNIHFVSFMHNKEARTNISVSYSQILNVDFFNASSYSPSNVVVLKKDGEQLHFFSVMNIQICSTIVLRKAKEAEYMIKKTGETGVIKDGMMTKQGNSVKTWKERFFVLYPDRLIYKKDQASTKEMGQIPLKNVLGIEKDVFNKDTFAFNILTVNRRYILHCQSAREQSQWVAALQTTLKRQNLLYPFVHVTVGKRNFRGKFQKRVLQFDFLNKRINNLKADAVKKMHPFANVVSSTLDKKDKCHIMINFQNQPKTEYDIFTLLPEHANLIESLCSLVSKNPSISVKEVYAHTSGLLEKSGFAYEKSKKKRPVFALASAVSLDTAVKRWLILQAGQIVVYNGSCDGYPLYCLSLHDCTVSGGQSNKEEMIISLKDGSLKKFEFSSVQECEEWVKLCRRYSMERTNDEFFAERETIVLKRDSVASPVTEEEEFPTESSSPSSSSLVLHKASTDRRRTISSHVALPKTIGSRLSLIHSGSSGDISSLTARPNLVLEKVNITKENPVTKLVTVDQQEEYDDEDSDSESESSEEEEEEDEDEEEDEPIMASFDIQPAAEETGNGDDGADEEEEEDEDFGEIVMEITNFTSSEQLGGELLAETTKQFEALQGLHNMHRILPKGEMQEREMRLTLDLTALEWRLHKAATFNRILLVDIIDVYAGIPQRVDENVVESITPNLDRTFTIATHNNFEILCCEKAEVRDLFVLVLKRLALY